MAQGGDHPERDALIGEAVATPVTRRYRLTTRVVPVGLAVASLLFVTAGIGGTQLLKERLQHVVRLDLPTEPCDSYPWLMYQESVYSNLGNAGPDSGKGEGMVIRARDRGGNDPARIGKNTFLVLNSTDDKYKAAAAQQNGLQGRFGSFNMPGSSELNFKLSFRDENETQLTMKHFALTFFDLDSDVDLDFSESIAIAGYKEYFTTPDTEVQIKRLSDGLTNFAASTVGTGNDNPLNPMAMAPVQKNRAVSFIFENVTEIFGSVRTSSGDPSRGAGFRVFNFVSKNSLACARDIADIPAMPLQDLNYHPPMEVPVEFPAKAIFDSWMVNVGDKVQKGDTLALINEEGVSKEVKSDKAGTVIALQPLVRGDTIGGRLIELHTAVIDLDKLPALHTSAQTSKAGVCSADNRYFKKYHVAVGDNVHKGDKLATTTLVDGSSEEDILAPKSGGIAALQPLKNGEPCKFVEDMNLVTLGKFAPLSVKIGETPASLNSGDTFGKWLVDIGDAIKEGQPIAVINTAEGTTIQKQSAYNGTVVERQALLLGSPLDEALSDETLVLVRSDGKLRSLNIEKGEESIKVPSSLTNVSFAAWTKQVGESVVAGEAIATLSDEKGKSIDVAAPRSGTVTATVEGLKPGDKLEDVMSGDALATIGDKLRSLTVRAQEFASHVPKDNLVFKKWLKLVGQNITAGEVICALQDKQNNTVNVTAEVHGLIVAEQDLKPNDVIDDMVDMSPSMDGVQAQVLAVIDLKLRGMPAGDGENAASWKDRLIFKKWKSKLGDNVTKGQALATLEYGDGTEVEVSAPTSGLVTAVQEGLIAGTALTNYPGTIATIADKFRPLKVLYGEKGHDAEEGDEFDKFLVKLGEEVQHGQSLVKVTTKEGKTKELKCERAGLVVALQDPLDKGMKINEVMYDQNLVVTGLSLRSLEVGSNQEGVKCPEGSTFKEWEKEIGDRVEKDDIIATVMHAAGAADVMAPRSGIITDRQEGLWEGMKIDDVMKDRNLAVVADEFGHLGREAGGEVVFAPPGSIFKKWHVNVGDHIKVHDLVATLENRNGQDFIVQAATSGMVKHRQDGLREGMQIDDMCEDDSLIVIGKLPALISNDGMAPVFAPVGTFLEWKVEKGDEVKEGDPLALIKGQDGEKEVIKSPKGGTVFHKQAALVPGSDLAETLEAGDICVIGRFTEMKPTWTESAVHAPPEAIFKSWHTEKEQRVNTGDLIATVAVPSTRRLEVDHIQGRRLETEWVTQEIKAPTWGTVSGEQHLLPGMTVGDQQVGSSIASIDSGTPWWLWLSCILAILCCCLCCLFCVMKKPLPAKDEPYQELDEPVGLDFHDGERIHRIFPKYRPLGIKHESEAPIIVKEFTVNSYAKRELEIQKGWKLVAINGEELNDSTDFAWVSNKLGDYMKDFDLWPLFLEFKSKGNDVINAEFISRPIGVEFENRSPIRVSSVTPGTPADEKGIKPGMLLTNIGGEDVSGKRPYKEVLNMFKEAVISLDTRDGLQRALSGQSWNFDGEGGHGTVKDS